MHGIILESESVARAGGEATTQESKFDQCRQMLEKFAYHSSEEQGEHSGPDELPAVPGVVPVERQRLHRLPAVAHDLVCRKS